MRIGFCCKYLDAVGETVPTLNTRTTTVAWLNRQTPQVAEQRLWEIMEHNIQSIYNLVDVVGDLPPSLRMVRLSSDILPVYTEPTWRRFWQLPDTKNYAIRQFALVGELARRKDVRVSFHPGQFCVMASANPDVVERSIEEFEYHADMARWMGYGQKFQDFKINVHISGKRGPEGIRQIIPRLSSEARNCLTIENDEISWGIDASLELADVCALVLDIHHHFIREGEYIESNDDRVMRIIDSWRGVRPVIHYSYSRSEHLPVNFDHSTMPNLNQLLTEGCKKQKLRAHSDDYPNQQVNDWALSFWENFDIQCEAKNKNLASFKLYEYASNINNLYGKMDQQISAVA